MFKRLAQQETRVSHRVAHDLVILKRHVGDRIGIRNAPLLECAEHLLPVLIPVFEAAHQFHAVLEGRVHTLAMERHYSVGGVTQQYGLVPVMPVCAANGAKQAHRVQLEILLQV